MYNSRLIDVLLIAILLQMPLIKLRTDASVGGIVSINTDKIESAVIEYLLSKPIALVAIIVSYLSGHLWGFIAYTFFLNKDPEKTSINTFWGRIAVGLCWLVFVSTPVYYYVYSTLMITIENYLNIISPTLVFSLFLQFSILVTLTCFKETA